MLDNASISALVGEHGKWLMAFLRGLVANAADAEDAFQETWLRVIRSKGPCEVSAWRAYLIKAARSTVIDRFRRRHATESLDALPTGEDGDSMASHLSDGSSDPAAKYESKATAAEVRQAIAALPLNLRQVVLMRVEGELEFKEIAAELGIPLGTALTWMRKATQELKKKLGGVK